MALPINGVVGGSASAAAGSNPSNLALRIGSTAELIVDELHGRYYESTVRKQMFTAGVSTLIATATTASPSTTITGAQVLYNPIGNTNNVVITKVSIGFALANLAGVVGIATGFNAGTAISGTLTATTATAKNKFLGSTAPTAASYASASITLPTAVTLDTILFNTGSLATTGYATQPSTVYDFEGSIILPPGGYATIWSNFVIPASSLLSTFSWEEVSTTI
jgi:hypothetical protein